MASSPAPAPAPSLSWGALLPAALLLAGTGGLLLDGEQRLRRAEALADTLTTTFQAETRAWEGWLDPWLSAWLQVHRSGDTSLKPALYAASEAHLRQYAALSTHRNEVRGTRIAREQQRALAELGAILGPRDAAALLTDLDNAWGRAFQGMEVTLPTAADGSADVSATGG